MDKKTKVIIGPGGQQIITPKPVACFSKAEREYIIQEYLSTPISKNALWLKYTGKQDHGRLLDWMRQLGYDASVKKKRTTFIANTTTMEQLDKTSNQQQAQEAINKLDKALEELTKEELQASVIALKNELALAKKGLEEADMRVVAYSTMIDIAEREFNIPIRKKSDTKPYKK